MDLVGPVLKVVITTVVGTVVGSVVTLFILRVKKLVRTSDEQESISNELKELKEEVKENHLEAQNACEINTNTSRAILLTLDALFDKTFYNRENGKQKKAEEVLHALIYDVK